jgi:translation initiation factor 4G
LNKNELQLIVKKQEKVHRERYAGNVRFIGELYKRKILNARIVLSCISALLDKFDEESLECACVLMSVAGEALLDKKVRLWQCMTVEVEVVP